MQPSRSGRITILYVDARLGGSVRTLAEMIMDLRRAAPNSRDVLKRSGFY
jgi:hypothetical protein